MKYHITTKKNYFCVIRWLINSCLSTFRNFSILADEEVTFTQHILSPFLRGGYKAGIK